MKKKEFTLPTLLGLFIALGGLVAGIWLVRGQLRGSLQASPEESPQKVTVTNVGDTTATISWITDQAVTSNGEAAEGAIIYLQIPGAVTQSTIVKASGAWVIPLSKTRAVTLEDIAPYDISTTQLELRAEAGPMGSARMSLTTDKDSPAPQLVISSDETETAVQTPATQ